MFNRSESREFQYYRALEKAVNPDQNQRYALGWFFDWDKNEPVGEKKVPYCLRIMQDSALFGAFFGDADSERELQWDQHNISKKEILAWSGQDATPGAGRLARPNCSQQEAIYAAINQPITFIQGPPGTGKTETILNLLSCLHHKLPGATIAVVSGNNQAIANIDDKILNTLEGMPDDEVNPRLLELRAVYSALGSNARRSQFYDWLEKRQDPRRNKIYKKGKYYHYPIDYLRKYPIFSSTIHSLLKVFETPESGERTAEPLFDYVIVDECSQVSPLLGLIAMSRAKHLVLLGDDEQLPPVINGNACDQVNRREEFTDVSDLYKMTEGNSFLQQCQKIPAFVGHDNQCFLREHYRCHPEIIRFCNEYIYKGQLDIRTPDDGECPLYIDWYTGDYYEKWKKVIDPDKGKVVNNRKNERQLRIFMEEEWPELMRRMEGDPSLSVCVIAPFRQPLEELKGRLQAALNMNEVGSKDHDEDQETENPTYIYQMTVTGVDVDEKPGTLGRCEDQERQNSIAVVSNADDEPVRDIPTLTIHKAQGGGYDIVYYLSIEDCNYSTRWPWAQQKRLINVMASRAKKELHVITSAQWLPDWFLRQNHLVPIPIKQPTGISRIRTSDHDRMGYGSDRMNSTQSNRNDHTGETEDAGMEEDNLFLVKLLSYMLREMKTRHALDHEHVRRSHLRSVFDTVPYYRYLGYSEDRQSEWDRDRTSSTASDSLQRAAQNGGEHPASAPEQSFLHAFYRLDLGENYEIRREVPLASFPERTFDVADSGLESMLENGRFDFVIYHGEEVCAIIEVDGQYHREGNPVLDDRDARKDQLVRSNPVLAAKYFRLPTDGSNREYEMDVLGLENSRV